MKEKLLFLPAFLLIFAALAYSQTGGIDLPSKYLSSGKQIRTVSGLFYETFAGRNFLPPDIVAKAKKGGSLRSSAKMADGREVTVSIVPDGKNFNLSFTAAPSEGIIKWGLSVDSTSDEYYTGLMERVVDGPQQASWRYRPTNRIRMKNGRCPTRILLLW